MLSVKGKKEGVVLPKKVFYEIKESDRIDDHHE